MGQSLVGAALFLRSAYSHAVPTVLLVGFHGRFPFGKVWGLRPYFPVGARLSAYHSLWMGKAPCNCRHKTQFLLQWERVHSEPNMSHKTKESDKSMCLPNILVGTSDSQVTAKWGHICPGVSDALQ